MRKNTLIFLAVLLIMNLQLLAQIGITNDGSNPDASAMLEVKSSEKGFLPPRLTTLERNTIVNPAAGLMVFNTDNECIDFYTGSQWVSMCSDGISSTAVFTIGTGGACANSQVNGIYMESASLDGSNTIDIEVNVTKTGTWRVTSDTLNAYWFFGSGEFSNTGTAIISILADGIPSNVQTDGFTMTGILNGGICTVDVTVVPFQIMLESCGTDIIYDEVSNPLTGDIWLDKNIGAALVPAHYNDFQGKGSFFQWGRLSDGHECVNWINDATATAVNGTTLSLSSTDVPGHNLFIIPDNSAYNDWREPQNVLLWQGVSGVNNPCPQGFRIPQSNELEAERLTWGQNNRNGAFASPLKWVVSGFRSNTGSITQESSNAYIWSSTIDYVQSKNLYIGFSSSYMGIAHRGEGNSVRCIKD